MANKKAVSGANLELALLENNKKIIEYVDSSDETLKGQIDEKVPATRTVNGKALSGNITLKASDVGADASGTATSAVSSHNTSTAAHNDIRLLIEGLTTRLNSLADSDDTTLDQMSEVVAYIKANKSLIDSITTNKVNVSDIVNNLTTNVSNKPLSAAQGVAIKSLIDALQTEVDSMASSSDLASHTGDTTAHITSTERTNWNAAKSHADSAHAPSSAEPNQNAFAKIAVGTTTIEADSKSDTLTLAAGTNVTITPDATGDKITISATDTKYTHPDTHAASMITGLATVATSGKYSDLSEKPTIPTKTSELTNDSEYISGITKTMVTDALGYTPPTTNTTYGVATSSTAGLVKSGTDITVDSSGNVSVNDDSHNHVISNVDGLQSALDGKAASGHTHSTYVNQNAFSNVKVGSTTVAADTTTDTLTLEGSNVTITPDATNDKVTIGITKDNVTTALGYTPPSTNTTYGAAGTSLGLVKSGGDLTITDGVATVNDDSHNHVISNVDGLQSALDAKVPTTRTVNGKALSANISLSASDVGADASGAANTALTNAKAYTDTQINAIMGEGAADTLNTIGEISKAIEDHQDVTDALNAAIGGKQATVTGAATTITANNLTASRALVSNSSGKVAVSDITSTELGHLDGVTSNIQTQLNGKAASGHTHTEYAASGHTHSSYANQNAFSNVKVGDVTVAADTTTDTLTLAGSNVTITPDTTNDKVTIGITKDNVVAALGYTPPTKDTNTHYTSKNVVGSSTATSNTTSALSNGNVYLNSVENGAVTSAHKISGSGATTVTTDASGNIIISSTDNNTVYSHPTSSGNKHIPSGGSSGQILRWSADGTAVWGADNNTTYGVVSTTADGLAPKRDGSTSKFLRGDGTWATPPDTNTTYSNFVKSGTGAAAGLVPAPSTTAGTTKYLREDGTWQVPPDNNTTYSAMTAASSSTAGKAGLVPAPAAGKQSAFLRGDGSWSTPTDTKNTAGSTNSSSKLYLIGATSQAANPQTYSHDTAYVGTDGCVYSNSQKTLTVAGGTLNSNVQIKLPYDDGGSVTIDQYGLNDTIQGDTTYDNAYISAFDKVMGVSEFNPTTSNTRIIEAMVQQKTELVVRDDSVGTTTITPNKIQVGDNGGIYVQGDGALNGCVSVKDTSSGGKTTVIYPELLEGHNITCDSIKVNDVDIVTPYKKTFTYTIDSTTAGTAQWFALTRTNGAIATTPIAFELRVYAPTDGYASSVNIRGNVYFGGINAIIDATGMLDACVDQIGVYKASSYYDLCIHLTGYSDSAPYYIVLDVYEVNNKTTKRNAVTTSSMNYKQSFGMEVVFPTMTTHIPSLSVNYLEHRETGTPIQICSNLDLTGAEIITENDDFTASMGNGAFRTDCLGDGITYEGAAIASDVGIDFYSNYGQSTKYNIYFGAYEFFPYSGSGYGNIDLGSEIDGRWRNIYAQTSTIITSDRKEKKDINSLDESVKDFIMGLNPSSYKLVNGTSDRTHYGLIAQDVEDLLNNLGIDSKDFAGFIKSQKYIRTEEEVVDESGNVVTYDEAVLDENGNPVLDEDGNPVVNKIPKTQRTKQIVNGEYTYSLRYEEFIAPMIKMIQMQQTAIEDLQARVVELESKLAQ